MFAQVVFERKFFSLAPEVAPQFHLNRKIEI
jgi:hypothetical protein